MKRAKLTVPPRPQKTAPPDLTDRLLNPESGAPDPNQNDAPAQAEQAQAHAKRKPPRAAKRTRKPVAAAQPAAAVAAKPDAAQPAEPRGPALPDAAAEAEPVSPDAALALAQDAVAALLSAARGVPARYNLALRYRLHALAHHLQQVAEFVKASLAK